MKNILTYKGYSARVYYDPEDKVFVGDVLGLPEDMITFDGEDVETLERRFRESVEAYLEDCARTGRKPVKPCTAPPLVNPYLWGYRRKHPSDLLFSQHEDPP